MTRIGQLRTVNPFHHRSRTDTHEFGQTVAGQEMIPHGLGEPSAEPGLGRDHHGPHPLVAMAAMMTRPSLFRFLEYEESRYRMGKESDVLDTTSKSMGYS